MKTAEDEEAAWMRMALYEEIDEASADGLVAAVEVILADPGSQDVAAEVLYDNGAPKAAALFAERWEMTGCYR